MSPQEALRRQIDKNERILEAVRTDAIAGITAEGRSYKEQELMSINSGLRAALQQLEDSYGRRVP